MKNSIYILSALFISVTLLSSCSNKKGIHDNELEFEKFAVDTTYRLYENQEQPSLSVELKMDYPVKYKNQGILTTLQQLVIKSVAPNATSSNPEEALQNMMNQQIAEYRSIQGVDIQEMIKDHEDAPLYQYEYTTEEKTVFNKGNIFCFSATNYSFTGGAHGLQTVKYTCVNLDNGTVIKEQDLFVDDYQSLLSPIIVEKLVTKNNLKTPKDLENNGFFDITDIHPNGNFYIDEKGITYVYNPYEIAAYSLGISEVFIPYADITFILAPKSPVKRFL